MVLEPTFRKKITSLIEETLTPHGIKIPESDKTFWNYRYDDDFKYGKKAGLVSGIILGYYFAIYGKKPSESELLEIRKMIESYKEEIQKSFSDIHIP